MYRTVSFPNQLNHNLISKNPVSFVGLAPGVLYLFAKNGNTVKMQPWFESYKQFLLAFKPVNFGFELVDHKWETVLLWKLPLTLDFSIWNLYYNQLFIPALYSMGRIQCCLCPLCLSPGGLWWGRWNSICYLFINNLFIHLFIYLFIYVFTYLIISSLKK